MGLFDKFKAGLQKTHSKLTHEIKRIVTRSPKLEGATLEELEAALIPLGAKPHWGKVIHADAATLAPLYPRMADFRSCALRCDPERKFRNAYLEKHIFG